MVDILEACIHYKEFGTLGCLIVGVVILEPSCPASHFLPRVVMHILTFREYLQAMIHLGTVEVFMYPAYQCLPFGMVRRAVGVPLLP